MADFPLAVVTGGAHRLGRAFALTLAYQGYAVLVHYHRSAQQAAKTVAEIKTFGVPAFSMQADLTQPEHVEVVVPVGRFAAQRNQKRNFRSFPSW